MVEIVLNKGPRPSPFQKAMRAADAARDRKDWPQAADLYAEALEADDAQAAVWVQYGHALKEQKDLAAAETAYRRALEIEPAEADTHLQLGHLLKLKGDLDGAAAGYARAAELDPALTDAREELRGLARRGALEGAQPALVPIMDDGARAQARLAWRLQQAAKRLDDRGGTGDEAALRDQVRKGLEAAAELERRAGAGADLFQVVFDVSDLVGYFDNARLPTGIQRVQIEVISSLLRDPVAGLVADVCAFSAARDQWIAIDAGLFLDMADLALASGDRQDVVWTDATTDLKDSILFGEPIAFRRGAWLVNLGTSWWLQNYFLQVRRARAEHGVRYVPFVHDMIPIMAPEHCVKPLTQDFISWALGVFAHTDHFFSNSESSKADLIQVAAELGHTVDPDRVHVVRLDADFRRAGDGAPLASTLARYGLTRNGYVLFVSTVESRKNHLNLFKAWSELIRRHGAAAVPMLVCVGNRGWMNDQVFSRLESDTALASRVLMLSGVADDDLANLYRTSAFTAYPSQYEGWGLPVTESLCHGRPVLLSDSSSLPEAGGDFGVYFHLGDQDGLIAQAERLVFDTAWRDALAQRIAAEFRPRPWRDLAVEMTDRIRAWAGEASGLEPPRPPRAGLGRYYPLHRSLETRIAPGMTAGEVFRSGSGWTAPDDWGCWTKGKSALLSMTLEDARPGLRLYLGLRGLALEPCGYTIICNGRVVAEGELAISETRWIAAPIPDAQDGAVGLRITSTADEDLAVVSAGVDPRHVSVGVVGFMVCEAADLEARADFSEALAMGGLAELARR